MSWVEWAPRFWAATLETFTMVGVATFFTVLAGLPIGVLLVLSQRGGLLPAPALHRALGLTVNIGRSLPFIILLVAVLPLTRLLVGTSIGTPAAIVPLALAAIPFFARVVEAALREVDPGLVEAAEAMGCTPWQVVRKVLLPEALPALVLGLTITVISLVGYSAMAGAVGGGGLGDLAIRYGYQRFETGVMVATVVLLVALVQGIQLAGSRLAQGLTRR